MSPLEEPLSSQTTRGAVSYTHLFRGVMIGIVMRGGERERQKYLMLIEIMKC